MTGNPKRCTVLHAFEPVAGDPGQVCGGAGGEVGRAAAQAGPRILGQVELRGVGRQLVDA
jgi:hypothetical protein